MSEPRTDDRASFISALEWPLPLPAARDPRAADQVSMVAGRLLQVARWHAGLSQAEAAQRAGTSQQTLLRYETGRTQPTLPTLARLLAACGMGLDAALVPQAAFDDPAIDWLLDQPPHERLPLPHRESILALVPVLLEHAIPVLIADRPAARLYGAPVPVNECEFLLPTKTIRVDELEAALTAAGGRSFLPIAIDDDKPEWDGSELLGRHLSRGIGADVRFCDDEDFDQLYRRSHDVELAGQLVAVVSPPDVVRQWHERERDRLVFARAVMQRRRREGRRLS